MVKKIASLLISGFIIAEMLICPINVYAEGMDQETEPSIVIATSSDADDMENEDVQEDSISDVELETTDEDSYQAKQFDFEARLQEVYDECVAGTTNDLERFTAFAKWIADNTDYSTSYHDGESMLQYGSGTCWASTDLILMLCDKAGIEAGWHSDDQFGASAGTSHANAIARINGTYYIGEAGYVGEKPRYYSVYELPYGVVIRYVDDCSISVLNYGGLDSEVIIPEIIDGKTVTRFADKDYYMFSRRGIESVILPDTVTSLGKKAFFIASDLKKVYIPKSVTSVSSESFLNTDEYNESAEQYVRICTITDIYYSGTKAQWKSIEGTESVPSSIKIHYNRTSDYAHDYDSTLKLDPDTNEWIESGTCKNCGHKATLKYDDTVYDLVKAKVNGVTSYYKSTKGKYDATFNGIARHETGWYCVKNGRVDKSVNAVKSLTIDGKKAWYVIKNGKVLLDYTGFAKIGSSWMYFTNGDVDKSINSDHYGSFYGEIDGEKGWYVVKKGKAYPNFTGFALVGSSWMCYKNGKVDKSFTGTKNVTINGVKKWYYIENGKAMINYYGFAKVGSSWMYFSNGSIDKSLNGMHYSTIGERSGWILIKAGKFQSDYTGAYLDNGSYYYFENGFLK